MNHEMPGSVLGDDHGVRVVALDEVGDVLPLLVRHDDLLPLLLLEFHRGQGVVLEELHSTIIFLFVFVHCVYNWGNLT